MYAIIAAGGQQYTVKEGDRLVVDKVGAEEGTDVTFDNVLFVKTDSDVHIGTPSVDNAKVVCKVVAQTRDKKVLVFKKKRRQGFKKLRGHRSFITELVVEKITVG